MPSAFKNPVDKSLIVLIPAHNEAASIGDIVREVKEINGVEVIVIDDASTDATREIAREAGAKVLPLTSKSGAWGATRTGLRYAVKHGYGIAVTMDADGQHQADYIHSIVEPLESDNADVVIGSCLDRGSPYRKLIWTFFRKLTRLGITDLTSGFRAYKLSAIPPLISADTILLDYQDIGVLFVMQKMGFQITEIPVCMNSRTSGESKIFHSWGAILKYLLVTIILSLSKFKMRQ